MLHRYLVKIKRSVVTEKKKKRKVVPPKLPETTNLVLTKSKNEYSEMRAMNVNVIIENKRPPL
jgi:hypothetical protein